MIRLEGGVTATVRVLDAHDDKEVVNPALKLLMLFAATASLEIMESNGLPPLVKASRSTDAGISRAASSILHTLSSSSGAL